MGGARDKSDQRSAADREKKRTVNPSKGRYCERQGPKREKTAMIKGNKGGAGSKAQQKTHGKKAYGELDARNDSRTIP